jgi:hypothetical protein
MGHFGEFQLSKEQEEDVWKAVQRIFVKARSCCEDDMAETEWGQAVIRPLLETALRVAAEKLSLSPLATSYLKMPMA